MIYRLVLRNIKSHLLVGHGSGKSTLLMLLSRIYKASEGKLY